MKAVVNGMKLGLAGVFAAMQILIAEGATAKVTVVLDGKDVGASAGSDVKNGVVTVDTDRLYTLINLAQPGDHTVTLQFQDGNAELFAFTFG